MVCRIEFLDGVVRPALGLFSSAATSGRRMDGTDTVNFS